MSLIDPHVQDALQKYGINYEELECDPNLADTAAFCEHYGFSLQQSANTIIVASKAEPVQYAACLVLADSRLDVNKTVRKLMSVKKVSFASGEQTTELTGMMIGGVVIFGLPEDLPIYVDARVMEQEKIVVGGGNRSSKTLLNPKELSKLPNVQVIEGLAKVPEQ